LGKHLFGLIPHLLKLAILSLFVKQLRSPRSPWLTKKEAIAVLKGLLESGMITPIIDSTFQLSDIREAFRHMIEDEIHGKVILTPSNLSNG